MVNDTVVQSFVVLFNISLSDIKVTKAPRLFMLKGWLPHYHWTVLP